MCDDIIVLDILFCQIATFIKVCVAFIFGLQTLWLICRFFFNLSIKCGLEPKNKGQKNFYERCDLTKKYIYYDVDRLRRSTSKDAGRNLCEKRKKNEWSRQPNASQVSNRIKMGWYPAAPAVNIGICMYVWYNFFVKSQS